MNARTLSAVAFVVGALFVGHARAQSVPLPEGSVALQVGFASVGPPVVVVDTALREAGAFVPVVQGRFDLHARTVGVSGGGMVEQRVNGWFFLREAAQLGPFVAVADDVAVGLRGGVLAQAGFDVADDITLAIGPAFVPVLALDTSNDRSLDGRLGCSLVGAGRWFVLPTLATTVTLAAGYDIGGHGAGAMTGEALVGVLAAW
jgi:hypothetical protein